MAAYLGHRAADKGRLDPQHSSQPASHHPLRHHHVTVCFDGGLLLFEVLIKNVDILSFIKSLLYLHLHFL